MLRAQCICQHLASQALPSEPTKSCFHTLAWGFQVIYYFLFFSQMKMTPFMDPNPFVLLLIIRAVRGGAHLACLGKKNSPASGKVSSAKGEIAKIRKEEGKRSQQPLLRQAVSISRTKYPSPQFLIQKGKVTSPSGRNHRKGMEGRNHSMLGE